MVVELLALSGGLFGISEVLLRLRIRKILSLVFERSGDNPSKFLESLAKRVILRDGWVITLSLSSIVHKYFVVVLGTIWGSLYSNQALLTMYMLWSLVK